MTAEDRVVDLLRTYKGKWVPATRLMQVGGLCGWRTRLSEASRAGRIAYRNRQRLVRKRNGTRVIVSEYRWLR